MQLLSKTMAVPLIGSSTISLTLISIPVSLSKTQTTSDVLIMMSIFSLTTCSVLSQGFSMVSPSIIILTIPISVLPQESRTS